MKEIDTESMINEVELDAIAAESGLNALLDGTGRPVLRADLYQAKRDAIIAGFVDDLAAPLEAIDSQISGHTAQLEALESFNLANTLTTDELARANGLNPFIADDCTSLDGGLLAPQIESAIRAGDKVLCFLYHRHLSARPKGRDSVMHGDDGPRVVKVSDPYAGELAALRRRLDELLSNRAQREAESATIAAKLHKLRNARRAIELVKRRVTGQEREIQRNQRDMVKGWV